MHTDPARVFLWAGLVWHGALRAYWVSLVVRITIDLDLPEIQLVLLGTAMEGALLVSEVPTGVVADAFSRKWSVVIGFVGVGAAQIIAGLVEPFSLLLLSQVLWGVAYTFRSGAETAWITDELGGHEAVEVLLLRRARLQLVVSMFAIFAGVGLARLTSLSTTIVLTGVILVGFGLVLAVVMAETGFQRPVPTRSSAAVTEPGLATLSTAITGAFATFWRTVTTGGRVAWSSRSLRTLVVVLLLAGLASEAIDRLDIRRLDDIGLSADLDEVIIVGIIAAAESALGAAVLWWSQSRVTGARVATGMATLLGLSAFGVAALGLVAFLPVAMAGLVFQGGLRLSAQPLAATWTNAHARSDVRATVHSFIEQANSVGEIGGGILLGTLAAASTVPTAMTVSVVLLIVAAVVAGTGRRTWTAAEPSAA